MQSTIIKLVSFLLLMLLAQNLWAYVPSGGSVYGSVYTRGVVLDENGDATYVAYGDVVDDNNKPEFIATVNTDEMRNAQVMATAQANAVVDHFQTLRSEYPDIEVLTREAYSALPTLPNAPTPESYINFVVVRGDAQRQLMVDGSQLVLQQSIIDPRGQYSGKSLLVSKEGKILASSEGNIGLRASFLRNDDYEAVYDVGSFGSSYWRNKGYSLVHPLKGLRVTTWGTGRNLGSGDTTNEEGRYSIRYRMFCPGFQHELTIPINVELKYSRFNPRGKINATYFFNTFKYDYCSGLHASLASATSLTGQMAYLNVMAIELFLARPIIHRDIPIDVIILDGAAGFDNRVSFSQDKTRYDDNKSSLMRTAQDAEDFDKDGTVDKVATGKFVTTKNDAGEDVKSFEAVPISESPEFQAIWLSRHHDLNTLDVTKTLPSYTRLLDWSDDFNDRALLSKINKEDLQNTDIYLIRESDGTLITERRGVKDAEAGIVGNLSTWDGEIKYTLQIVNRYETRNGYGYLRRRGWEKWQAAGNMNPKFYTRDADHLRIGEFVKIVAINRATGYMGSISTEVKSAGSGTNSSQQLSFDIERIKMRPPNLKVSARRTSKVQRGITKNKNREQYIGNEGAGLSDDKTIVIYTEWLDHDGSPLPAVLDDYGFTGRLANVNASNHLANNNAVSSTANSLNHFAIKPGLQTQIIRLPENILGEEHLYVHVSGEPQKRRPDLSSGLTEGFLGNFDTDPSKYEGESILKYRPAKFVPVKVPVFDEKGNKASLDLWKIAKQSDPNIKKPDPTYRWLYRPEFQVSVYDLMIKEINRVIDDEISIDIHLNDRPFISPSDSVLELLYNLTDSQFSVLDAYSYNDKRELVFGIGDQEIKATIGENQEIQFDNLEFLNQLEYEDFFLLKLYANNDSANVLWELGFVINGLHVYYKIPHTLKILKLDDTNPNLQLVRTLGGIRLKYAYEPPEEQQVQSIEWSFDSPGWYCQEAGVSYTGTNPCQFKTAGTTYNQTVADSNGVWGVWWEPATTGGTPESRWEDNIAIDASYDAVTLDPTTGNTQNRPKDFRVESRSIGPNLASTTNGSSDIEMLETLLWQLGISPQYGYAGVQGTRIDKITPNGATVLAKDRDKYSTGHGYATYKASVYSASQRRPGSHEKMIRRLQGRFTYTHTGGSNKQLAAGESGNANGILDTATLQNLKTLYKDYMSAYSKYKAKAVITSSGIQKSWLTAALNEWAVAYDDLTHQGILTTGETVTREDLLFAWVKAESPSHWGEGDPDTDYRMTIGGADEYMSISFNQILFMYSYGANPACVNGINMYDPAENLRAMARWSSVPSSAGACDRQFNRFFVENSTAYIKTYDNTNRPNDYDGVTAPKLRGFYRIAGAISWIGGSSSHTDDGYEKLSKALLGYNAGVGLMKPAWANLLIRLKAKHDDPLKNIKESNLGSGLTARPYHGMEYAIKIKKAAKMLLRTYRFEWTVSSSEAAATPHFNTNDVFCFDYSEQQWYDNVLWKSVKNNILATGNGALSCQP